MSVDRDQQDRPALDDSGLAIQLGEGTFKLIQAGDGSYKEFLKVLSRLGGGPFEELILVQDVPDTTTSVALPTEDDDRNIPRPISLPPFKKLSIDCSASTCSSIMRHITIPQIETLTLKLRARPYETRDERFAMLLPLALDSASRSVIAPASARVIASLSITWGNVISILAWTTSLPPSQFFSALQTEPDPHSSTSHSPAPSLYASLEGYPADMAMSALCAALPVPNLTMLSLTESSFQASENERLDARQFSILLWLAPTVETLSISVALATDLPRLLSPNTAHPDGPKLPQLKVLNIGPSALNYHKEGNNCRPSLARLPELMDVLCDRMTVGSGLDMLRIPHYFLDNLRQAQKEKLRRCAAAVHLSRYPDGDVIWKAAEMV